MSDIDTNLAQLRITPEQTLTGFDGFGRGNARIGVEREFQFFNTKTGQPLTIAENHALTNACADCAVYVTQEAAAQTLEIKTDAFSHSGFGHHLEQLGRNTAKIQSIAEDLGLTCSTEAILPQGHLPTLLNRVHPRERSQVFVRHFTKDRRTETARYFSTVSGAQLSLSYETKQQAHDVFRRAVFLLPVVAGIFAKNPATITADDGSSTPVIRNETLWRRTQPYGIKNSISQAFWHAASPEAFLESYDRQIWDTKLFCHYDTNGKLHAAESPRDFRSLNELPPNLQTAANYALASSIQWQLVALSALPGENGIPRRRIECRFIDPAFPGLGDDVLRAIHILGVTSPARTDFDTLCEQTNLTTHGKPNKPAWLNTIERLAHTDTAQPNVVYNLPYGNTTLGKFAAAVGDILAQFPEADKVTETIAHKTTTTALRRRGLVL